MPGKTLLKTTAHRYQPTGHARKGNSSDGLLVDALLFYFSGQSLRTSNASYNFQKLIDGLTVSDLSLAGGIGEVGAT
jgi:hypothetical protein